MTTIRITLAALALSASASFFTQATQASEITEFPTPTTSTMTRAEVQAEARKHYATGSMSINFAGIPANVTAPVSMKTRADVSKELAASRGMADARIAAGYFVGGM